MKKFISFMLAAVLIVSALPLAVFAEETADIHIFYKENEIIFEKQTVLKNNIIMCQMEPLFDALGIAYEYNAYTKELKATFEKDKKLTVTLGEKIVTMDLVNVETEQPFYAEGNTVMVPLDTLCYVYNIDIDRSDLSNVRLDVIRAVDTYDRQQEIMDSLATIEDCKETVIAEENLTYFETATRERPDTFTEKIIDVEGQEFDKALDWEVTFVTATPYEAQLADKHLGDYPLKKGDLVVVSLWAKQVYAIVENQTANLGVCFEELNTWQKVFADTINLSDEWQKFYFVYKSPKDIENWQLCLRQHFRFQEIQVANVGVDLYRNIPEDYVFPEARAEYKGMEEDALWRREAFKRIEEIRKNDMVVNVVDENGNPIENAEVKADMTRHEFLWGINLSHYGIGPENLYDDSPHYFDGFLDEVKELGFNFVVEGNAFKPSGISPKWVQDSYNWCVENDMDTRLHLLFWEMEPTEGTYIAEYRNNTWDKDKVSQDEIRKRIEDQTNKLATFGNTIDALQIDVINEIVLRHHNVVENVGYDEPVRLFNMAKQIMPNIKLYVTETATGVDDPTMDATKWFVAYLKYLKEIGCEYDAVGLQGHSGGASYPQYIVQTLDMVGEYTDEISILEYDMSTSKPAERGPFTRDVLIAAFSHPKMQSFVLWQPVGGGNPDNGILYDLDGTKRPAYYEWKKLITEDWMTHEELKTDKDGKASFRGFRGRYDITVRANGKSEKITVNLTDNDATNVVTAVVGDKITLSCPTPYVPREKKYVNWRDYGEKTDIEYPQVNYPHIPETEIVGCYNSIGMSMPHLLDEVESTFWMQTSDNDYVTVELKDAIPIKQLNIDWHDVNIKRYSRKIEVSADGKEWTTVTSGINKNADETVDMKGLTGKYIRISGVSGKIAVNDIEIFAQQ